MMDAQDSNLPRRTDIGVNTDVNQPNERFLFREPVVLLTIVSLALLNGIDTVVKQSWALLDLEGWSINLWSLCQSAIDVTGLILFAFISEVHGRKPVYIVLFILTIISSILHAFPIKNTCIVLGLLLSGLVRGGKAIMNTLSISEYCSPKHRFAYMVAQVAAWETIGYSFLTIVASREALTNSVYLMAFQIVLGLVCLISTWMWPESPYWLASKGRLEDSRKAFLWLRGKEGEQELRSVMKERRSPGPPKLYWISLVIALATISISMFSDIQRMLSSVFYDCYGSLIYNTQSIILMFTCIVVFFVTAAISSYHIKRKLLFIVISGISFVLSYAIALWFYLRGPEEESSYGVVFYVVCLVSQAFLRSGPSAFAIVLFTEIIPLKYNTHIVCICLIYNFISMKLLITLVFYLHHAYFIPTYVYRVVLTTLALGGVILYYFFAPETKNKTLLEIQRMYTREQSDANPEQSQIMMQNRQ